jgi:outer membrane immunogenic protein
MRCDLIRSLRGTCVFAFVLLAFGAASAQNEFTGFYVGANGGGTFGRLQVDTSPVFSPTGYFATTSTPAITAASNQTISTNGFNASGVIGYSHQWDNFVFGLEADFGSMSLSGSTTTGPIQYPCCPPTPTSPNNFTVVQTAKTSWMLSMRPRFGWVFGHFLAYGTVGADFTNVKYTALFTDTFAAANESASIDETRPGWIVGGGGEYRLAHHWSVKGEYIYSDFGTATVPSANLTAFPLPSPPGPFSFPTNVFTHTVDPKAHIVRAGVNFRF